LDAASTPSPALAPALRLLAAAPHRLLFFVGAANVLLAMGWWTLSLSAARFGWPPLPAPPQPPGWMHAIVMQYQVLPPFMFGFLLTVFPRWLGLPALRRAHYVPVGIGLLGGQLLTLLGLLGSSRLLVAGLLLTTAGWAAGWLILLNLLRRAASDDWHPRSVAIALGLGLAGLGLVLAWLATGDARLVFAAIKFGGFGLLLPVYFTINHRMTPFFASCVQPGYPMLRPGWALAAFWMLAMAHLGLECAHGYAWLWIPDLPMAGLTAWLLWRWMRAFRGPAPALLRVLWAGFAWLPLAFGLYAAQSLWFAIDGAYLLGRAPAHALFIGYFGSLLVAMVTRVTQGHAGRPLVLGRVAGFAFVAIQLVAVLRVVAEVAPDPQAWQVVAALGWLLAFSPWVLRSAWIYLTPRVDGKAG
jgi:uncharacterized protein involved in response to NO